MFGADGTTIVRSQSLQFSSFVTNGDYADYTTLNKVTHKELPKVNSERMPWWYIGIPTALAVMGLIMVCSAIFVF